MTTSTIWGRLGRLKIFLLAVWMGFSGSSPAAEWPQYRGANHDGVSPDRIMKQWTGTATNALWRVTLGAAYSSFAAAQGKAVTQVYRNSKETCIALSLTNGTELWSRNVDSGASYGGYNGPRSTPTMDSNSVYVLTSNLKLLRLNITNGFVLWSNNLVTAYGAQNISWASAASPLVENGLIFVNLSTGDRSLAAFRTSDGSLAWRVQNEYMTHSTPVTASIRGYRQVIFVTQNGLISLNVTNGQKLWDYPFAYNGTSLGASPVVHSNIVFVTQSYTASSTAVWVDCHAGVWSATNLWDKPVEMIWMTPVVHGGAIFGATGNSGDTTSPLICMDLMTGETLWSHDGFGRGGVAMINNAIAGLSEAGQLSLIRPVTNAFEQIASFRAITAGSCWNVPAVCDGKLLVRSTTQAACFDLSMPDLQIASPAIISNKLLLTAVATNGAAIHTNRVAQMQVYARTNLSSGSWSTLTNRPAWSNGVVRFKNLDPGSGSPKFYRIGETE